MSSRLRWLIVAAVLAAGFAVVVFLSAWNTDISGPRAEGRGTSRQMPPDQMQMPDTGGEDGSMPGMDMSGTGGASSEGSMTPLAAGADGLKASAARLTLDAGSTRLRAGRATDWRFTIRDAAGQPVTRFERDQTKLLHLIVVRRDVTDYQHLYPVLGRDGEFSIPITVARSGVYRAIADFTTGGKRHVLGIDLRAPGSAPDRPLPAAATEALVDGYRVDLDDGELKAGRDSQVTFTVSRGGRPVESLQRYLGAYGHLVALRAGDLAYSHVHPTSDDRARGVVRFIADLPTKADYRLFFQFRTEGVVRTVAFTVRAR